MVERRLMTTRMRQGGPSRKEVVLRMAERAERAARSFDSCTTPFLPLSTWREVDSFFKRRSDVLCATAGGHAQAERRMLLLGRPEVVEAKTMMTMMTHHDGKEFGWQEEILACLSIEGNFKFDKKRRSHRHVLGSILGTGIDRGTVGDIIIPDLNEDEGDVQAIVSADMAPYLESQLTRIGRVSVRCSRVPLSEVHAVAGDGDVTERAVTRTCSSSRVDAVAALSFRVSRTKAAEAVRRGEVQLNWEPCTRPGTLVEGGDVITYRGKGRSVVLSVETNHRDRTVVKFALYS